MHPTLRPPPHRPHRAPRTTPGNPQAPSSFKFQANALLRKSATYQKRNVCTNICLLSSPIFFCVLLLIIKLLVNNLFLSGDDFKVPRPPVPPAVRACSIRPLATYGSMRFVWCLAAGPCAAKWVGPPGSHATLQRRGRAGGGYVSG